MNADIPMMGFIGRLGEHPHGVGNAKCLQCVAAKCVAATQSWQPAVRPMLPGAPLHALAAWPAVRSPMPLCPNPPLPQCPNAADYQKGVDLIRDNYDWLMSGESSGMHCRN